MARRGQFCCFFLWHCGSVTGSTFTRSFYIKPSIWNNGWQRQPKSAPLVNSGAERPPKILSSVRWCCISNIVSVTGKPCPVGRDRAGRQCGAENNLCLSPHFVLKLCPKVHISVSVALASDNGVRRALHRGDGPRVLYLTSVCFVKASLHCCRAGWGLMAGRTSSQWGVTGAIGTGVPEDQSGRDRAHFTGPWIEHPQKKIFFFF